MLILTHTERTFRVSRALLPPKTLQYTQKKADAHALGIKSRLKPPKTAKTGKPRGHTGQKGVFNIRYEQCIF